MKFLVDAHIGRLIVGFLEARGHDIRRASSFQPGTSDEEILRAAVVDERVVMTSDKDFGELVFRIGQRAVGIVLLRIDVPTEAERLAILASVWPRVEMILKGYFVTITNHRVRRTPLP